ncbi:hypothetical protein HAX54_036811 [Datura stramonium]|uniref:Uncharacterized protein n=1 Tax=Datura stramonium TaxID=4076 RepID=A0ABS8RMH1_DATST|nr:hypothetical protein [Datura stramonium]
MSGSLSSSAMSFSLRALSLLKRQRQNSVVTISAPLVEGCGAEKGNGNNVVYIFKEEKRDMEILVQLLMTYNNRLVSY